MAKLAQSTIKYLIEAEFYANGLVEKPDVIGAIFGQTEGLLGQDLDLRELQRTGRIGRIDVILEDEKGKTHGKILIPSSLDASETALIAAAIETIEKIGPCESHVKLRSVKDIRAVKRDYVVDRAKRILSKLLKEELPSTTLLTEKIKESVRAAEITECDGLPCGSDVFTSDEIIIVEGRADVLNLLKNGVKNVIATGGAIIPPTITKLCKEKITTVFLDGDRGGDLIFKELMQLANIDYVARAPEGKEVEELTKKEIFKALRDRTPVKQFVPEIKRDLDKKIKKKISSVLDKMIGTRATYIFDESMKLQAKIPLSQFNKENERLRNARIVVIDGTIDDDIVDVAESQKISFLIANNSEKKYKTKNLTIYTKEELEE
ncbi:MAG: DNA primase DnaG [Candidatus Aenigmarchaeota archaeon]|nr:DNA primase DnaG [Candidatus Aenigmarchaeota archaeon]